MSKRCMCSVLLMMMLGGAVYGAFDPLADSALLAWWKCDEGTGNVVSDSSPGAHNGTFVPTPGAWTTGVNGSAIRLIGPKIVEVPPFRVTLTQATMCGWFLPNGVQNDWASMIMHRGTGLAHGFNFLASRQLAYHWADATETWSYRGTAYYAADEWTHCAVTVEPSKATFYVNGAMICSNSVTHAAANWDNVVHLGGDDPASWSGRQMNGSLDDVMFFSRALTAAEIKSLVPPKLKAMKPVPANGTIGVATPLLQWTPGDTALFHNVYFATTPDLTEANLVAARQPFAMYYHVPGLQPGTTYYWRVDEIDAAGTITTGDVWMFQTEPLKNYQPKPADAAAGQLPGLILTWMPGKQAAQYQIYFGMDQAAVASGAASADKGKVTDAKFDTGALRASTTYYWRADVIKADQSVVQGDVWSFSTADAGPANKILWEWWSSIGGTVITDLTNNENYPSNPSGSQYVDAFQSSVDWADNYGQRLWGWLKPPETGDYTFWIAGDDAQELWLSTDGSPTNAVRIANVPGWTPAFDWDNTGGGTGGASQKSAAIKLEAGKKYFIMALGKEGGGGDSTAVAWQGPGVAVRAVIAGKYVDMFNLPPLQAFAPSPANGAVDTAQAAVLSWTAGEKAQKHDVYFGDDKAAVAAADNTSPLFKGSQAGTTYNAGDLEWGKTYYWRVDEINAGEAESPWKGPVWSFTTANFIPVDNFESYTDDLEAKTTIFDTWVDGLTDGKSNSTVGNFQAPFAEQTIVHGGKQSMPMDFDNSKTPFFSEAVQEFSPLLNWTVGGVTDLSLWVQGYPAPQSVAVTEAAGKITLSGDGTDIWNNSDQFTFAYKTLDGDGSITARVVSIGPGTNTWAKAGVMIRDSLNGGSTHAMTVMTANSDGTAGNGASFQYRLTTDGASANSDSTSVVKPPYWVKIERKVNDISAYMSVDGKTWRTLGVTQTIEMAAPSYIGLCVTSHAAGEQREAVFDSITTTGGVTGAWQGAVIDSPRFNGKANLYVAVEDSAGKVAVASDPALANAAAWTQWKIPLSSLTGVNLAKVKKLTIGVGDKANPVADGAGRIYIDDIQVTKP